MSVEKRNAVENMNTLKSEKYEPVRYRNNLHMVKLFQLFQIFRNNTFLCDIKLQTDDGTIIFGHKLVFTSASPYFRAMFKCFQESNEDHVNIRDLDSKVLQLLVDYMYTGEIVVTEINVQDVLTAADLLQLDYVKNSCVAFLQKRLSPSNCLGIKEFAELYNCTELLSISEAFIKKQFLDVVEYDEFLSLSIDKMIKLISCNDIVAPFEEKVFECVIKWVTHKLDHRKEFLPNLMDHVRLPLISKEYLLEKVVDEPLLKNNSQCKDYVFEALHYNLIKSINPSSIPQTIRSKPRQFTRLQQVILVLGWSDSAMKSIINWYDPATNLMHIAPELIESRYVTGLCVVKDHFVFAICGGEFNPYNSPPVNSKCSVEMLDVSSSSLCWVSKVRSLGIRKSFGIGVLDNCIYAIGGHGDSLKYCLNSVEVYNLGTQQWKCVSSMSNERCNFGVGVLNKLIYTVGGYNGSSFLNSVECYDPSLDKWNPVAEMSICRYNVSVGVLDGVMYAIGGYNGSRSLNSVEAYKPSTGVWYSIADMHFCRENPGVVALDGLLYVIGGMCRSAVLDSVEVYNPTTNSWSIKIIPISHEIYGAVVVNRPLHLQTN